MDELSPAPGPSAPRRVRPGRILDEAFVLYGEHARALLPTALLIVGIPAAIQVLLVGSGAVGLSFAASVISIIASALYSGFVVKYVEQVRGAAERAAIGELLAIVAGMLGTLIVNGILFGLGVAIGIVLLVVPGLFLLTIWSVAVPAIVIEGRGATEAFARSRQLVGDQKTSVFLTIALATLVLFGLGYLIDLLGDPLGTGGAIVVQVVAATIVAPLYSLIVAVLYFELRGDPEPEPAQPLAPT